VNLAQDFSPGTVLRGSDLVPEARLNPCSPDQFASFSRWFSHSDRMNFQFATADENGISSGIFRRVSPAGRILTNVIKLTFVK
jgi:hypothetical protein